jgi:hypothetical protein
MLTYREIDNKIYEYKYWQKIFLAPVQILSKQVQFGANFRLSVGIVHREARKIWSSGQSWVGLWQGVGTCLIKSPLHSMEKQSRQKRE